MAVRGQYTQAQQKMLDWANNLAESMVGWGKSETEMVADAREMKTMAKSIDYWNPLWYDDNYARGTRWGSIIAYPMFQERFGGISLPPFLGATPECGFLAGFDIIGDDWEFFKPIFPGDKIKVWYRRPKIEDFTSLDGQGPLVFKVTVNDVAHINQKDEVVSTFKRAVQIAFADEPPKPGGPRPETRYKYTKEELSYLDSIIEAEEIRGAKVRYWEDVNVGDETSPIELGPTTVMDSLRHIAVNGYSMIPRRQELRGERESWEWEFMPDSETGVFHHPTEGHVSDYVASMQGSPMAYLLMPLQRNLITRLVTNWMGDDGFIKSVKLRYFSQTYLGDSLIGRGRVTNKRIENGEHLVDLVGWFENLRGFVAPSASFTVKLPSKEAPDEWA